jgi:hypothetical protein
MAKRVVNEPGTALLVKMICEKPERDRPFKLRCTPAGGTVLMRDVSEDTAPIGTPPQLEYWNLDQTLYTGDVSQLTDCGAEKVDVTAAQWFCASGTPISRTDFWDVSLRHAPYLAVCGKTLPAILSLHLLLALLLLAIAPA